MCGKYTVLLGNLDDRMNSLVEICNKYTNGDCEIVLRENGEICPDDAAPSLAVQKQKVTAMAMRWGFRVPVNDRLVINARCETAHERKMFASLIERWRCALPASGYFEWRDEDNLRHRIYRRDKQVFYLAGLYRFDEEGIPRFVVLTREAYGKHAQIHKRMPCLLHSKEEARRWISGGIMLNELYTQRNDDLIVEAQEHEQLRMSFQD